MKLKNFISVNKHIHGGTPCINGTRIPVKTILNLLNRGISLDKIENEYFPQLKKLKLETCG